MNERKIDGRNYGGTGSGDIKGTGRENSGKTGNRRTKGSVNRRRLGGKAEDAVCTCLNTHGWEILDRNFGTRGGEIDIIAMDHGTLVFVEVKYRHTPGSGSGSEAVDFRKQRKITHTALIYLLRRGIDPSTPCRFDVAEISGSHLHLCKGAFEMEDFM